MNRMRLFAVALAILAAGTACGNASVAGPSIPSGEPRADVIATAQPEQGGGWTGSGHQQTIAGDTTTRGGGWAGSGH